MTAIVPPSGTEEVSIRKAGRWGDAAYALQAALADASERIEVRVLGTEDELAGRALRTWGDRVIFVVGTTILIPPAHGAGSCPQCVARRWQAAQSALLREASELAADITSAGGPPLDASPVLDALRGQLLLGRPGRIAALDTTDLTVTSFPFLADPYCPSCAEPGTVEIPPVADRLVRSPKCPGSFRSRRVEDYPLSVEALANPVCGPVGRGYVTELSLRSTAAIWGSFSTRTPTDLYEIFWGGHATSYDRSVRIGLLEGLERYAGMIAPESVTRASRSQLLRNGVAHLDPRECGLYDEEFYRRTTWMVRFTDELVIPWVPAYSLRDQREILVPEVTAFYRTEDDGSRFVQECSNGCASGASLTEAAYCGLMELIERDAFLLSWYGKVPLPEIDGCSSTRPSTRMMIDRLALYGYRARFFDARLSFEIPVVIGVAERIGGGLGAMAVGAGCGLDAEDALASALVEISTDSLNLRERVTRDHARLRAIASDFDLLQSIHDHPIVFGLPEMAEHADFLLRQGPTVVQSMAQTYAARPVPDTGDLADDLAWCVARLARAGFDCLVVDQTTLEQRELGLHTASMIVPGLLPIDFGWGRQRCLDMPRMRTALREAGRVDHDLTRADLHLVPHPFP
jgi:ribosomal protein S12 methylthiotransferase accessory factor